MAQPDRLRSLNVRFVECAEAVELAKEVHGLSNGQNEETDAHDAVMATLEEYHAVLLSLKPSERQAFKLAYADKMQRFHADVELLLNQGMPLVANTTGAATLGVKVTTDKGESVPKGVAEAGGDTAACAAGHGGRDFSRGGGGGGGGDSDIGSAVAHPPSLLSRFFEERREQTRLSKRVPPSVQHALRIHAHAVDELSMKLLACTSGTLRAGTAETPTRGESGASLPSVSRAPAVGGYGDGPGETSGNAAEGMDTEKRGRGAEEEDGDGDEDEENAFDMPAGVKLHSANGKTLANGQPTVGSATTAGANDAASIGVENAKVRVARDGGGDRDDDIKGDCDGDRDGNGDDDESDLSIGIQTRNNQSEEEVLDHFRRLGHIVTMIDHGLEAISSRTFAGGAETPKLVETGIGTDASSVGIEAGDGAGAAPAAATAINATAAVASTPEKPRADERDESDAVAAVKFTLILESIGLFDFTDDLQADFKAGVAFSLGVRAEQVSVLKFVAGSLVVETAVSEVTVSGAGAVATMLRAKVGEGSLLDSERFGSCKVEGITVDDGTGPGEAEREEWRRLSAMQYLTRLKLTPKQLENEAKPSIDPGELGADDDPCLSKLKFEPWDYACQRLLAEFGVSTMLFVQRFRDHMPPPSWSEARRDGHRAWLLLTYAIFISLQQQPVPGSNGAVAKPASLDGAPRMRLKEWRVFLKYTSRVSTPIKTFQAQADMDITILEAIFKDVTKEATLVEMLSPRRSGGHDSRAGLRAATPPRARRLNQSNPTPPAIPHDEELSKMRLKDIRILLTEHDEPCDGCVEKTDFIARAIELRDHPNADRPKLSQRKSQSLPPRARAGSGGRSSLNASPHTPGGTGGLTSGSGNGSSSHVPNLTFLSFQLTLVKLARDVVCREGLGPEETLAALLSNELVPVVAQLEALRKADDVADLQESEDLRRSDIQALLSHNQRPLWNVYKAYCPESHEFGQKKSMPFEGLWKLLKDFDVMPHVIDPLTLFKLYTLSVKGTPDAGAKLSFEAYQNCLVRVALRTQLGNVAASGESERRGAGALVREPVKEDDSPVRHLENLLEVMNSSEGSLKLQATIHHRSAVGTQKGHYEFGILKQASPKPVSKHWKSLQQRFTKHGSFVHAPTAPEHEDKRLLGLPEGP